MDQLKIVKIMVGLLIAILIMIGLLGTMYSFRRKSFYISPFLVVWCICVSTFLFIIYVRKMYVDLESNSFNLNSAVELFYYLNIMTSAVNYLSQLWQTRAIKQFYNTVPIFDTLTFFDLNITVIRSSVFLVFVKVILFPIIIEMNLILKKLHDGEAAYIFSTFYTLYPMMAANFVPNCAFGAFVTCRVCTDALNRLLESIEREANFYQDHKQMILYKPFHRMQVYCNLADKLDQLSEKYSIICVYLESYLQLAATPILASLLCNLFGITAGLFQQYNAIADAFINDETYDVFEALTNGVFLVISIAEIALQATVANECKERVRDTSIILKRIHLENCDIRFCQSVERFSLKIFVEHVTIQPLGLLEIDIGLLHDVFSAVTSFLLILIQSDLTLRFSLK